MQKLRHNKKIIPEMSNKEIQYIFLIVLKLKESH